MKHIIITIIYLLVTLIAIAQDNLQIHFGYRGSVAASKLLPSTHNLDSNKFELNTHYNAWVANKSISYSSIRKIYLKNALTPEDVDEIIGNLKTDNKIGLGQDFMVLGIGYRLKTNKNPISLSFTISDRFNVNTYFPKALVQLVWQGNKQFEGKTVDLSNTYMVGMYFREYALGAATQVLETEKIKLRAGFKLNYYQGLSGVINQRGNVTFYTAEDADYLLLNHDFEHRYTGIEDFDLFDTRGHGFGINLGASLELNNKMTFDLGVSDLGRIKFKNDISRLTPAAESFEFSGLGLTDVVNPTAFLDSLENIFTPETDIDGKYAFKMPVGVRLSLMGTWEYGRTRLFDMPKTLSFFYTQGFSENPGVTISPKFTIAINRPIARHFVVGASAGWGGFNSFAFGGLAGMHFKHFRFSIHSDDITGLLFKNSGTGGGFGFLFQVLI